MGGIRIHETKPNTGYMDMNGVSAWSNCNNRSMYCKKNAIASLIAVKLQYAISGSGCVTKIWCRIKAGNHMNREGRSHG